MNRPKWTYTDPERYGYGPTAEEEKLRAELKPILDKTKKESHIRCQTCKGERVEWVEIGHGEWDERPCSDCQGES